MLIFAIPRRRGGGGPGHGPFPGRQRPAVPHTPAGEGSDLHPEGPGAQDRRAAFEGDRPHRPPHGGADVGHRHRQRPGPEEHQLFRGRRHGRLRLLRQGGGTIMTPSNKPVSAAVAPSTQGRVQCAPSVAA